MQEWNHGYNVSRSYTYNFYRETSPSHLDFCARLAGYLPPDLPEPGRFRYLELGSGQGFGLCLLAAANPGAEFIGIDFNPAQIAHSNQLARQAGLTNIHFMEGDFLELGHIWPAELGQFDYLVAHGIYSWIPKDVRLAVLKCLDKACRPGGLVYLSYNAMPGAASTLPFQHLARRFAEVGTPNGKDPVSEAVAFFEKMEANQSNLLVALPTLKEKLRVIKTQDPSYLAHEYLNGAWEPLWFSEIAGELSSVKLDFVGSATIADHLLYGMLPEGQSRLISGQRDPLLRQDVQDCVVNRSFRRDLFCRGARRSFRKGLAEALETKLVLVSPPLEESKEIQTGFATIKIRREMLAPIISALECGPTTLGKLLELPAIKQQGRDAAFRAIVLLLHSGTLAFANDGSGSYEGAHNFNAAVARYVADGAPYSYIATPLTGSGIALGQIDLLFLDARFSHQARNDDELAQGLQARLLRLDQQLADKGQPLESSALDAKLMMMTEEFNTRVLPSLLRVGAVT